MADDFEALVAKMVKVNMVLIEAIKIEKAEYVKLRKTAYKSIKTT